MRTGVLVLSSLLLTVLMTAAFPAGADGSSWGPEEVLVHLRVRFDTVRSGELTLFIGNASEGSMVFEELSAPVIMQGPDSNLVRLHLALLSSNDTWGSFLRSVMDPDKEVVVTDPLLHYSSNVSRFGALFTARFNVTGNDNAPDYRLLTFIRSIRPRKLDPNDPYSSIERDRDIDRLSKIAIRIEIEPPKRRSRFRELRQDHDPYRVQRAR
ncbi:MAG: hypothetical protein MUC62_10850 [Candidatus Thermoplasmatota archaeon]|nr:hypothetical protein [Candidatus Thermoplasmatota archaeon]